MNLETLYARLHAEGRVASSTAPALPPLPAPSPWYTRAMLGFAGWIAGLFIVAFFGSVIVLLFRDGFGMLLLAAALCGAAVIIDRRSRNDLIAQFALALSMAGQVFFALGLDEILGSRQGTSVAMGMVVLQAVLFAAIRNPLHRVWSVAVGAAALYYVLHRQGGAGVAAGALAIGFALLWALEERWRALASAPAMEALGWGLALALLAWTAPTLVEGRPVRMLDAVGYGAGLLTYAAVASRRAPHGMRVLALGGAGLLAVAAQPAPGIVAGALVLLAGYGAGQRAMAGLGVIGLLAYLSVYYYQLDQTLLEKAQALAATGLVLLAARFVLTRAAPGGRP